MKLAHEKALDYVASKSERIGYFIGRLGKTGILSILSTVLIVVIGIGVFIYKLISGTYNGIKK